MTDRTVVPVLVGHAHLVRGGAEGTALGNRFIQEIDQRVVDARVLDAGRSEKEPHAARTSYRSWMLRDAHRHRVRVGLVLALIVIFAGIVVDSLLSASWALDDGLLLAAAAIIGLALFVTRGRSQP